MNLNESKDSDRLDQKKELKILLIGDCQVGKTCLSLKYFNNNHSRQAKSESFSHAKAHDDYDCIHNEFDIYKLNSTGSLYEYSPTTLSVYKCEIKINSADYSLSLTDTSGCRHNEKFHQLRKHYYSIQKDIDVIMMCFSLVDPVSFSNISKKWYPEVRSSYPDVPILLVGTKLDIKHQIKYQKKHMSKKSTNTLDDVKHQQFLLQSPINTPDLIINNRAPNESFVNELNDGTLAQSIDNTAAMLNNKLAAATSPKSSFKKKSFKRCNYCSSLDQKSRSSKSSFLSTLTSSRQAETRARAVSIISKVSQQHTILVPQQQQVDPLDLIDQETKLLENIHESNANLIAILNEDSAIISSNINEDDTDLVRYNIDEYGVVDDEAFDADYFKSLNLAEDNCLCGDTNNNNANVNDFNSYKLDQYDINENNNNNNNNNNISENNECQLAAISKLNTSVKTLLLDTSEPVLNEATLKQPKEADSESDLNQLKTATKSEIFLIKRRDCLKLKQSMNARKYLECSCLDDISVKIVMDTAIELALEYHLNKLNKLSKQTSNCSKLTTQTVGKNSSLFKYSGLIGSLMKDSSLSTNSNLNSSNACSQQSKEFSLFSLSKSKSKAVSNEKRDSKTFDDDELKKKSTVKSLTDLNIADSASITTATSSTKRKQSKSKSQSKPDRQLSLRCLSCTRGINDTSSSLNKI